MTIDSNILIGYLNKDETLRRVVDRWKVSGKPLIISTISIAEVLSFESLTARDVLKTEAFLQEHFFSVKVDDLIAREAGRLRRIFGLKLPDAIVAATALTQQMPLVTRDEDFIRVSELDLIFP